MNLHAIIQARLGSTRFKNKVLKKIVPFKRSVYKYVFDEFFSNVGFSDNTQMEDF